MSGFEAAPLAVGAGCAFAALDGIGALAFGVVVTLADAGVPVSGVSASVRVGKHNSAGNNTRMPRLCFLTIIILLRTCTGELWDARTIQSGRYTTNFALLGSMSDITVNDCAV